MKKEVALVLSSGGARGFAHIGVIKMLEERGYKITSVAGTSMGALVGGFYAAGGIKDLEAWVSSLDFTDVLRLTDFSISKKGLVRGKKVIDRMKELVPDRNIEDLVVPYCAVATDIISGEEKVFTMGNLYDAIRASISIPTVFQPFQIGNDYYVDGGVVNPIPVNRIKRGPDDLLFVVDVNSFIPYTRVTEDDKTLFNSKFLRKLNIIHDTADRQVPKNHNDDIGMFNLTNKSIGIMLSKITELTMKQVAADLVVRISKESFGTYDFYKAKEIIDAGADAAKSALIEFENNKNQ
jgi:NTE family protein